MKSLGGSSDRYFLWNSGTKKNYLKQLGHLFLVIWHRLSTQFGSQNQRIIKILKS